MRCCAALCCGYAVASAVCSIICLAPLPPPPLSPQFGHLFAKGETREAAIRAMVVALKEIKIRCALTALSCHPHWACMPLLLGAMLLGQNHVMCALL